MPPTIRESEPARLARLTIWNELPKSREEEVSPWHAGAQTDGDRVTSLWPREGPADFAEGALDAPARLVAHVAVPAHGAAGTPVSVRVHARPTVVDQEVPRPAAADVVDGRDLGVDDPLPLELLVEGEDGALRGSVDVACAATAGGEGARVCFGEGRQ